MSLLIRSPGWYGFLKFRLVFWRFQIEGDQKVPDVGLSAVGRAARFIAGADVGGPIESL